MERSSLEEYDRHSSSLLVRFWLLTTKFVNRSWPKVDLLSIHTVAVELVDFLYKVLYILLPLTLPSLEVGPADESSHYKHDG